MTLEDIDLELYNYQLDIHRIAEYPKETRDGSRLLFVDKKNNYCKEYLFEESVNLIPENSLIIRNSTKVLPARIFMKKYTGGNIEVLLLKPLKPFTDYQVSLNSKTPVIWECIIGGRIKNAKDLEIKHNDIILYARIHEIENNIAKIQFEWNANHLSFSEVINSIGKMPLPPYIKRESNDFDKERYQTIYAATNGSVAAPTAGLHFTDALFNQYKAKQCIIEDIVLHVGMGTFVPISSNDIHLHKMHSEKVNINISTIKSLLLALKENRNIIAIGTTSVRTIESLAWWAYKFINSNDKSKFHLALDQYEPYDSDEKFDIIHTLEQLIKYMQDNNISTLEGNTSLLISQGYKYKIINGIFTNFHLPKSTLLLLVSSFIGYDLWKTAYNYAITNSFRFLSYGDSSFLFDAK
ncbi:MAG TPA: S-adenosylmethionine:tRNA ribosyltransferase-isomerase [Candidatus Kapabacteria bacterium]|nr:S-adenosylmethionine:tRNA ribosyltransferase-isomerase [Candidatus Kapabacteria bacterium]